jgi:peptidyl-tRNA hydrolase, PTH1 family
VKLFAGLGNPGPRYEKNRHNIGYMAVDAIADAHAFSPWRGKFSGQISEGRLGLEKILLLKPGTFMNLSGDAVQAAMAFYKLVPEDLTVFHDELDLSPGRVRVKTGGGHAGHNGLRSITTHVGPDFHRIRLGIGHPGNKNLVSNYVLGDFAKFEHDWLDPLLRAVAECAPLLADADPGAFQSELARKLVPPPRPKPKSRPEAPAGPAAAASASPAPDARSRLQKLVEKFR